MVAQLSWAWTLVVGMEFFPGISSKEARIKAKRRTLMLNGISDESASSNVHLSLANGFSKSIVNFLGCVTILWWTLCITHFIGIAEGRWPIIGRIWYNPDWPYRLYFTATPTVDLGSHLMAAVRSAFCRVDLGGWFGVWMASNYSSIVSRYSLVMVESRSTIGRWVDTLGRVYLYDVTPLRSFLDTPIEESTSR